MVTSPDILVGLQWGDEGKGKIVDHLAKNYDWVVRYQGGSNAGHTVYIEGEKFVLHMIPTGILRPDCKVVIAAGCVVNPSELLEEIEGLEKLGIDLEGRLFISDKCHVTTETHLEEDKENQLKFGSTGKGIGPTYRDKVYRKGIRFREYMLDGDFRKTLGYSPKFIDSPLDNYITNTEELLRDVIDRGERVLLEGAQGTLLDLDYGTYPDVTSTSCVAQYAPVGSGLPLSLFSSTQVYGVVKAFATRVGTGPFPSEILDEDLSNHIRTIGGEFGATTGRPRRIGWLDLDLLKRECRLNGVTGIFLTKLDTLSELDEIYTRHDGKNIIFKDNPEMLSGYGPIEYYEDLPQWAIDYITMIEDYTGVKVLGVGIGPNRKDLIYTANI